MNDIPSLEQAIIELDREAAQLRREIPKETDIETLIDLKMRLNAVEWVLEYEMEQLAQLQIEAEAERATAERQQAEERLKELKQAHDTSTRESHVEINGLAEAMALILKRLQAQRQHRIELQNEHTHLFLNLHGRWPDEHEALSSRLHPGDIVLSELPVVEPHDAYAEAYYILQLLHNRDVGALPTLDTLKAAQLAQAWGTEIR